MWFWTSACFGLQDPVSRKRYRKTTRLRTNCKHVVEHMACRCDGNHEHQTLEGQVKVADVWVNRTAIAQVYPSAFVDRVVTCMRKSVRDGDRESLKREVLVSERLKEPEPRELLESVRRCHVNLGHPSRERLVHMLKSAGANDKAIQVAKDLRCSVCESRRPPESHRVAKARRPVESYNEQVNMDTFELPIHQNKRLNMLSCLTFYDEGSGLQICIPLWKGRTAEQVRKAYRKSWKRWAGCPMRVWTDNRTQSRSLMGWSKRVSNWMELASRKLPRMHPGRRESWKGMGVCGRTSLRKHTMRPNQAPNVK